MFGPDLFRTLDPPAVHVILHRLDEPGSDERLVTMSVQPRGGRGLQVHGFVSRYSPENTVMVGLAETLELAAHAQGTITATLLQDTLREQLSLWAAPF